MADQSQPFEVASGGATLRGDRSGEGRPVVLLHGLTATRRYVVQGSRLLARRGRELVGYDARGHGESDPAPDPAAYAYEDLAGDLATLLDELALDDVVLAGHSMGATTALAYALDSPGRIAALVQITPAYAGEPHADQAEWEALAEGLERDGVDGFMAAFDHDLPPDWREQVLRFTRQRLERHRHPGAVVDALRVVPRSTAFHGLEPLESLELPVLLVGSRDEADPAHPLRVAEAYAERLTDAELVVEDPGDPPLAWQGAQLSREIARFLDERGV